MGELSKVYDPKEVEQRRYRQSLERGDFRPSGAPDAPPYSIVMPTPNITGTLHMGHALNHTLQDILVRRRRMQGYAVLWVPGTDHAGIATQNIVERQLRDEGNSRQDYGRERFIQRVWKWRETVGRLIVEQIKRLGDSCDWDQERFSMDEGLSKAVQEAFIRLFEQGLIYRARYLINWCPRCRTALSDLEVEHEETPGTLYRILYPFADGAGGLVVATTRPETMLGDVAVAVHPEDVRYRADQGRSVILPLVGRRLPVIADRHVDPAFGTGALKITPAHDPYDFEIGLRHGLPAIQVIDEHGRMTAAAGPYAGQDRFEARDAIVQDLRTQNLLVRTDPHPHSVGRCYRCRTVVEPLISTQWFVRTGPLAEPAIQAVRSGRIRLIPSAWENTYYAWMDQIRDWCISRQIWWGHQIPAWYCTRCDGDRIRTARSGETEDAAAQTYAARRAQGLSHEEILQRFDAISVDPEATPLVSREAPTRCRICGGGPLLRDPDVLDTWFSSALWPFSTLGWPADAPLLRRFYPTSVLVTAFDILFFWVARMIMMGLRLTGNIPFKDVYIHAIVRDPEGQKMSKSKGNVVDPLELMDHYGTDALRFTLASQASPGRDVRLSREKVEGNRNFANKLWNAARFVLLQKRPPAGGEPADGFAANLAVRWIGSRLHRTIDEVNTHLEEYRFDEAAQHLYHFIWHEYCDWYIELSKPALQREGPVADVARACLYDTLEQALLLLHPFMPFITEEILEQLSPGAGVRLKGGYPQANRKAVDEAAERKMGWVQGVVSAIRTIRGEMNLPVSRPLEAVVRASGEQRAVLSEHEPEIKILARLGRLSVGPDLPRPPRSAAAIVSGIELYLPLEGVVDLRQELARLDKAVAKLNQELLGITKKLGNEDFRTRAPAEVVAAEERRKQELVSARDKLIRQMDELKKISGGK